ncbi:MAG: Hsp20/alpha crystallin family protein [Kofleriaceae bacterium]
MAGERKLESESTRDNVWRSERLRGQLQRVIVLPESVDVESADAHLDNGVLSIRLRERDQGGAAAGWRSSRAPARKSSEPRPLTDGWRAVQR